MQYDSEERYETAQVRVGLFMGDVYRVMGPICSISAERYPLKRRIVLKQTGHECNVWGKTELEMLFEHLGDEIDSYMLSDRELVVF
ncbi:hypothetical protein ES707_07550 [subsurface metagenome]